MTNPVGGIRPNHIAGTARADEPRLSQTKDGRLVLAGSGGGDQFNVRALDNGSYGVNVAYGKGQDRNFTFSRDQMSRLTIAARGGADKISVASNVDVPIRVRGGAGDDQIINGANGTRIRGGAGNDFISNTGDGVDIRGGRGADTIHSRGSGGRIRGGAGDDNIRVVGDQNILRGNRGSDRVAVTGDQNSLHGGYGRDSLLAIGYGNNLRGGPGADYVNAMTPYRFPQLPQLPVLPWGQGYGISPFGWGC